jgi:hypothetical protein
MTTEMKQEIQARIEKAIGQDIGEIKPEFFLTENSTVKIVGAGVTLSYGRIDYRQFDVLLVKGVTQMIPIHSFSCN